MTQERPTARTIVVIGPTPPPFHGVAVMTNYIVAALDALGACAGHLDTRDPRPVQTLDRLDVTNVMLALRHTGQLARILRQRPAADVLLPISQGTWGFLRDAVFVLVAHLYRREVILHLHGGNLPVFYRRSRTPMRWLIRSVFRHADQVWALTPRLCAQFDGLASPDRIRWVENVIEDSGRAANPASAVRRREGGPLRILFLSNLLAEKGCFDVIAIVRRLGVRGRGWQVRLAGPADPAVAERLQREIAELGRDTAQVTLVGSCEGDVKRQHYMWADVFLYPTRLREGQPLVLLEAMAAGLAIVASDTGGIPDTVRHNAEGLLVPSGDLEGFSGALSRLAASTELRCSLGRAARARYEARYRPSRLQRDLARLFSGPEPARSETVAPGSPAEAVV